MLVASMQQELINVSSFLPQFPYRRLDPYGPEDLPKTCSVLPCTGGGFVYLVGTSHFSLESNEDVRKVMRLVRPDVVVLELCAARAEMLKYTEEELMAREGRPDWASLMECIKKQGRDEKRSL